MSNSLTIILPAFNEEASLPVFLPELLAHSIEKGYQVIVVNDGSTDDTKKVLQTFEGNETLTVLHHKLNKGYGAAIKSGVKVAITTYVITIDADGQHQLSDVDALLQETLRTDADMAVGNRGGATSGWYRNLGKSIIRGVAKLLMPLTIKDLNSGMKLYNTELGQKYLRLCPDSMAYSDVIALVFISQRHLVIERDITVKPRIAGVSTISARTAFDTLVEIVNIVMLFNPYRIFFPASIISIVAGLTKGVPILWVGKGLSTFSLLALVTGVLFIFLGLLAEQLAQMRKNDL